MKMNQIPFSKFSLVVESVPPARMRRSGNELQVDFLLEIIFVCVCVCAAYVGIFSCFISELNFFVEDMCFLTQASSDLQNTEILLEYL